MARRHLCKCLLLSLFLASAAMTCCDQSDPAVFSINDKPYRLSDLKEQGYDYSHSASPQQRLREIIDAEVFYAAAKAAFPQLYQQLVVEALLKRLAKQEQITDSELNGYYDPRFSRTVGTLDVRKIQHLLVGVSKDASVEEREKKRKERDALFVRVSTGESFESLIKQHSTDSSASNGGYLGYFPRGAMVKPFEQTAFALKKIGDLGVADTEFGFHILRCAGTIEDYRRELRERLLIQKQRQAIERQLRTLRSNAEISYDISNVKRAFAP